MKGTIFVEFTALLIVILDIFGPSEASVINSTRFGEGSSHQQQQQQPHRPTDSEERSSEISDSQKYMESCMNKPTVVSGKTEKKTTMEENGIINDQRMDRNPLYSSPNKRAIIDGQAEDSGKIATSSGGSVNKTPLVIKNPSNGTNINRGNNRLDRAPTRGTSIGIMPRNDDELLTRSLTLEKKADNNTPREKILKKAALIPNNTEVIAQVGGTATLSCFTGHISDEVVTWLKREDDQLLTIGQELYANEARFSASLSHSTKAWELFVRDVQLSDAGQYECQLTTHPPVTFLFSLKVTQAKAEIRGPKEVHIEEGSQLDLQCIVKDSPSPPVYIFWYHNGTMVNYESQRGLMVHLENFVSNLVVAKVTPSDAGIYTCDPHLATRAGVTVHVVTGETPAAMQHGKNSVVDGSGNKLTPFGSQNPIYVALFIILPAFIMQLHSHLLCSVILHVETPYKQSRSNILFK